MGQKIHPIGYRVGIIRDYRSHWFSAKGYSQWVYEDAKIRRFLMKDLPKRRQELASAGIAAVDISRAANRVDVVIHTARPGVVIGRQGKGLDEIRDALIAILDPGLKHRMAHSKNAQPNVDVRPRVEEIRDPDRYAQLVADNIAQSITRRVAFKRAMRQGVMRAMRAGAQGIKVRCAGRLGGSEMARVEMVKEGKIPLQTIRADVDYALAEAPTTYGNIGVKVWIYRGDVMPGEMVNESALEPQGASRQLGDRRRSAGRRGSGNGPSRRRSSHVDA